MKLNLKSQPTSRVVWMHKDDYAPFAMALVKAHMTSEDEVNLPELRAKLDDFANGGTTAKGKSVYLRNLLGAIKAISPELAAALVQTSNKESKGVEDF